MDGAGKLLTGAALEGSLAAVAVRVLQLKVPSGVRRRGWEDAIPGEDALEVR